MLRTTDILIELRDIGIASPSNTDVDAQRLFDWLEDGDDTAVIAAIAKSPILLFEGVLNSKDDKRSLLLHILQKGNYALKSGIFQIACSDNNIYEMYQSIVESYAASKMKVADIQKNTGRTAQNVDNRRLKL